MLKMNVQCVVMRKVNSEQWKVMIVTTVMMVMMMNHVIALTGPNVCTEKQKYNITKRIKYMAPVSVRSYEWCMAMPPRCSRWTTEMRQLTRLENEERTAGVEVCCAGYKIRDIKCVPICPNGKTGNRCSLDCPPNKWGPNCVHECRNCTNQSYCSPVNGECVCRDGWKGERCDQISMLPPTATTSRVLTTRPIPYVLTTSPRPSTVASTTLRAQTIPETTTYVTTANSYNTSPIGTTDSNKYSPTLPINTISAKASEVDSERKISTAKSNDVTRTTDIESYTTTEMFSNTEEASVFDVVITMATNTEATGMTATVPKEQTIITSTVSEAIVTAKPSPNNPKTTTTKKFKPKEIWIKPAQKGDSLENKQFDLPIIRFRNASNRDNIFTTPKTIVVSIIPTSISTHKRAPLSVTPTKERSKNSESTVTKSMSMIGFRTSAPIITSSSTVSSIATETASITSTLTTKKAETTKRNMLTNSTITESMHVETSTTNSMKNENESNVTNISSSSASVTRTPDSSVTNNPINLLSSTSTVRATTDIGKFRPTDLTFFGNKTIIRSNKKDDTAAKSDNFITESIEPNNIITKLYKTNALSNVTNLFPTNPVTNREDLNTTESKPIIILTTVSTTPETYEDHTFHLLTEPEHITAVIGDKGHDRSSVDLIHVLSIAGGVMMAVITVAVVIVMVERCRKTRFDEDDKDRGMRMKVVMDNDGPPPPYVRSIFHTPLPEPPTSRDKCHYQPISTLDRNLKQFMRPVVVQSISPIMIENFRGILECHYDHLPRRSHCSDLSQCEMRCSLTPSTFSSRAPSVCTTVTIDTLKREAKFDEIDSTTSEPLYAEIPCWKPPLEHAVEITNMNGEAVTEL